MTSCHVQSNSLERPIPDSDYIRAACKVHLRIICKTPGVSTMSTSTLWGRHAVEKSDIIVLAVEVSGPSAPPAWPTAAAPQTQDMLIVDSVGTLSAYVSYQSSSGSRLVRWPVKAFFDSDPGGGGLS